MVMMETAGFDQANGQMCPAVDGRGFFSLISA
jgi:hypothetical protein